MGTIANQKNGSTVQLEIQAIGSSETSIMLQQPLLGTSSESYTVEVTQLMMSLGEERALSGNEFILAIVARPDPAIVAQFNLDAYVTRIENGSSEINAWNATIVAAAPNGIYAGGYNPNPVIIDSLSAYSATDFIYRLRTTISYVAPGLELGVSPSGQLSIFCTQTFLQTKIILLGTMFKAVSGWGNIIMGNTAAPYVFTFRTGLVDIAVNNVGAGDRTLSSKILDSLWETVDRRKRIRVDLSIPIGLTLGWKDTHEIQTYSLQEFYLPRNSSCSFDSDLNATVKETQLVGTTEFVNGGGKLALKRLFPGPVQVIRLALILIYEQYDPIRKAWVDKEKPVSMSPGDFFYLKVQFNKEST